MTAGVLLALWLGPAGMMCLTTTIICMAMDHTPLNDYTIKSFSTQTSTPSDLDTAIPLGREDDVEASHVLNEELGLIMGPREGSQGEGSWTEDEWEAFLAMLRKEKDFMSATATDLPGYTGAVGPFEIPFLDETKSSFQKPRRYSPAERQLIDEHFNKLLAAGIITKAPHYCENTCNVVVAMKKALDGTWTDKRVALDLRGVNELSKRDRTPPRLPEDLFHDMGKDQYITKLDLRQGFHQIPLTEDAMNKTCFWWAREGAAPEQYVYTRMPFGSTNSTAKFGRVLEHELQGLKCVKVYCDDISITSPTAAQHITDVQEVLQRLNAAGLRGHPGKSVFAAVGVEFLGFLLRPGRMEPHSAKVAAIKSLPTPKDVRGVRAVLGFMNFYRVMAARVGKPDYSTLAYPLNALLRKDDNGDVINVAKVWGKEHDDALSALKLRLTEPGAVIHAYDPTRPLYLMTDWSGMGVSAILGQRTEEGHEVIIAATSRTLTSSERRYSSFYGEALAVVYGVRSFRHYLHGVHFTIITDHQPLTWLKNSTTLTGMHLRWQVSLQEFDYDVEHRSGAAHQNADALSRYPRETDLDPTGASMDPVVRTLPFSGATTFACLCARLPITLDSGTARRQPRPGHTANGAKSSSPTRRPLHRCGPGNRKPRRSLVLSHRPRESRRGPLTTAVGSRGPMGTRSIPARVACSRRRAPPPERHQARRPLLQHQHEHHPQRRHARRLCERPATRGTVRRHLRRTRSTVEDRC